MLTFKTLRNLGICAILLSASGTAASAQTETNEFGNQSREPVEGSWIFSVRGLNGSFSFTAVASFAPAVYSWRRWIIKPLGTFYFFDEPSHTMCR